MRYDVKAEFGDVFAIHRHVCNHMSNCSTYEHHDRPVRGGVGVTLAQAKDYVNRQYWDLYERTGNKIYLTHPIDIYGAE
jgi:hypothetical protein